MIKFVNAKINIGLRIVGRRPDGYHNLETVFYPIGLYAGSAENPVEFCDILEVTPSAEPGFDVKLTGRVVDCPLPQNLVYRAAECYFENAATPGFGAEIWLDKHLPDGAGCGGGSADASFTLQLLNDIDARLPKVELARLAGKLGADCPFFIYNEPMYAEGTGDILEPMPGLNLAGKWLVLVKPDIYVSTREAFAGVTPKPSDFDLRKLPEVPMEEWREVVVNDFEASIFPLHPELPRIKELLYDQGAVYASMTGSGSAIYGIFDTSSSLNEIHNQFPTNTKVYLLKM